MFIHQSPDQFIPSPNSEPLFFHDCEDCTYLGDFENSNGCTFDQYVIVTEFEDRPSLVTLISRHGEQNWEYLSYSFTTATNSPEQNIHAECLVNCYNLYLEALARFRHPAYSGR